MATKPNVASPMESSKPLSKEGNQVILGDKASVHFEKKKDVWRLMKCEDSSLCREVEKGDMDKIAHHLKNLRIPIKDYCQKEKKDDLCELFALILERKTDQNITLISAEAAAGAAVGKAFSSSLLLVLGVVVVIAVIIIVLDEDNTDPHSI